MVRVISVDGENVKLRVVSDCMVDDIDITVEDLKKPIPYGMGYSILPQSICGVVIEDGGVAVEALPTVEDAVEWCKRYHLSKYNTNVEFHITPVEVGGSEDDINAAKELESIFLTKFETDSKLFVVPACVTHLDIGLFENTSIETIKVYGDTTFWFGIYVDRTNISKILLPEGSLYDFNVEEFGSDVTIEYFSEEV